MKFPFSSLGAALLLATSLPTAAIAADIAPPEPSSDWRFTASAYMWATGLSGTAGVFGLPPQDVDISFADIWEKLDFAVMALGEARNGPYVLAMDVTYSKLSADPETPYGILARSIDVTVTSWMVTGAAGYAVVDTDTVGVDLFAGARLWSVENDFELKGGLFDGLEKDDGATWVDPLGGAKLRMNLTPEIYATGWALIGGFGVGSDLMWDLMGGAGYKFTDNFSVFAGYRAAKVDYSGDGFVYDVIEKGPVMAAVFQF
jgi:opacity protein-like surface antigen